LHDNIVSVIVRFDVIKGDLEPMGSIEAIERYVSDVLGSARELGSWQEAHCML